MLHALVHRLGGRRTATAVGILLALALIVRVGVIAATPDFIPVADPADYSRHAQSISEGRGYPESIYAPGGGPSALRPPLYPYWLAVVYGVAGPSWTAGRLASALLGTIAVALIGLIALRLWGRTAGLIALGIAALYPPLILVNASLVAEALFLPLILGALAAVLEHRRRPRGLRWPVVAGVLLGLAVLDRPNGALLALPLAAALWTTRPGPARRSLVAPVAMLAAGVLIVSPWLARNASEFGAFVPVSTQDGYLLAGTYNRTADEDPNLPGAYRPANLVPELESLTTRSGLQELELSRELRSRAFDYVGDHPAYVLEAVYWNTLRLFDLSGGLDTSRLVYRDLGIGNRLADTGIYGFWLLAVVAIAGAFTRAARRAPWFVWAVPALLAASVVAVSGTSRYRMPIEPFVVLLATLGVVAALERVLTRRRQTPTPVTAAAP